MPLPYDATLKDLLERRPLDWVALVGHPGRSADVVDADVSTVTAASDKVLRVRDDPDWLLDLNFQRGPGVTVPQRLHLYGTVLGYLTVRVNGSLQPGTFRPTVSVLAYGEGGNDTLTLTTSVIKRKTVKLTVPALLDGGAGNDVISAAGSKAANVLIGGDGADKLTGGAGRDILHWFLARRTPLSVSDKVKDKAAGDAITSL